MDASRRKANPNPRASANPLSVLTFWNWQKELATANRKEKRKPSLLKALYHTFSTQLLYQGLLSAILTFVLK